jgi:AraC family chemosensory pili system transcriptional regulator ChpD
VVRLQELLAADLQQIPSLEQMAAEVGLSRFHLLRSFQKHTGLSPRQWAMQLRTRRAQGLLRLGLPAGEVAHRRPEPSQPSFPRRLRHQPRALSGLRARLAAQSGSSRRRPQPG